jgi:ubiquitin
METDLRLKQERAVNDDRRAEEVVAADIKIKHEKQTAEDKRADLERVTQHKIKMLKQAAEDKRADLEMGAAIKIKMEAHYQEIRFKNKMVTETNVARPHNKRKQETKPRSKPLLQTRLIASPASDAVPVVPVPICPVNGCRAAIYGIPVGRTYYCAEHGLERHTKVLRARDRKRARTLAEEGAVGGKKGG